MKQHVSKGIFSSKDRGINQTSRLRYLQDLEEFIDDFYIPYNQVIDKPYSLKEQAIIARIIKKLIRQLLNTPKCHLFSGKHTRRKLVDPEEEQELRNQKKDEARLQFTRITLYNPISKKYKAEKEKQLRKIREMSRE